jgi:hypothetical protein
MKIHSKLATAGGLLMAACLMVLSCGKTDSNAGTDSSTHWLLRCNTDAECGPLECICGACTKACTEPSACPNAAVAECVAVSGTECGYSEPVCTAECQVDTDCGAVRAGLTCVQGQCSSPQPGPGGGGTGGGGGNDCSAIPQCDFVCPEGTANPVDGNGCEHTCECVRPEDACANAPACGSQCPPGTTSPVDESGCVTSCTCVPAPTDAGSASCSNVPACEFACPEGTINPVDDAGCTHSCECVVPGSPAGRLSLFYTCGDPVCQGYTGGSGAPLCSTETAGGPCNIEGTRCDPQDDCNSLLICSTSDPKLGPGGCPISRRSTKQDIHYVDDMERAQYQRELLEMKLAIWRYKHDPAKKRLGIIIDDDEDSPAVDARRDQLDLYGYTSMVVAALQVQAREIDELKRQVAALKKAQVTRR